MKSKMRLYQRIIIILMLVFALDAINIGERKLKRTEDEILDIEYYKMQIKHEYIN